MNKMEFLGLKSQLVNWLEEDDLSKNFRYQKTLPDVPVQLTLKIKSPLLMAGTDYFISVFSVLGQKEGLDFLKEWEGRFCEQGEIIFPVTVPFSIAVSGERLALNLLQHASSIATWTKRHVDLAQKKSIKILDTRKTTPGMRTLEKYAVTVGGGFNHRFGQSDVWMIKDNHKKCLGGLRGALDFFKSQGGLYMNIIAEIHDLSELIEATQLGIKHVMLDNFSPDQVREAIKFKVPMMTYEVSGGLTLENLEKYLIEGVDAISLGSLTYGAPRVDLSLKMRPL